MDLLGLSEYFLGIFIYVWKFDDNCTDHAVAVFLYVYFAAWRGSECDPAGYGAGVEFLT